MTTKQLSYGDQRFHRIDSAVQDLHNEVWDRRGELWGGSPPTRGIDVLEPAVALQMLGYAVEFVSSLGNFQGGHSEAAGEIDGIEKTVKVSRRFLLPEQRFTLAHELGHAVCHPNIGRMHRDVPIGHSRVSRNPQEVEANHFAARFLMPEPHVRIYFSERFDMERLDLADEAVAYALCGTNSDTIRFRYKGLRALSRCVASAEGFNGNRFQSLASLFRVSVETMAIRLEELELIKRDLWV